MIPGEFSALIDCVSNNDQEQEVNCCGKCKGGKGELQSMKINPLTGTIKVCDGAFNGTGTEMAAALLVEMIKSKCAGILSSPGWEYQLEEWFKKIQ